MLWGGYILRQYLTHMTSIREFQLRVLKMASPSSLTPTRAVDSILPQAPRPTLLISTHLEDFLIPYV